MKNRLTLKELVLASTAMEMGPAEARAVWRWYSLPSLILMIPVMSAPTA